MNVLIVEDSPVAAHYLAHQVRISLHTEKIRVAPSLAEARRQIQEKLPDVILTDLQLEDSSGTHTIKALRIDAPDTPIIAVTADENQGETLLLQAGADDYLVKNKYDGPILQKSVQLARARIFGRRLQRLAGTEEKSILPWPSSLELRVVLFAAGWILALIFAVAFFIH
jgi:DNA-binding response OmpR family regulator